MAIDNIAPQAYTDLNGLSDLKVQARAQTPEALREAARQFESIFTRMMLKTMREASSGDELFDSQQSGFYRDMFDDQIAVDMSRGHGLGLADQLVAQMVRAGIVKALPDSDSPADKALPVTGRPIADNRSAATPDDFIRGLLPSAVAAGRELGVDPGTLLAHAALETGWGRSMPSAANGQASNNLFGVKADASWRGEAVASPTVEFDGGIAQRRVERFRAYESPDASFRDYVALLRDNPRYAAALGQGNNVVGFATALQKAGYATDPRYAEKLVAVSQRIRDAIDISLKGGRTLPITTSEAPG